MRASGPRAIVRGVGTMTSMRILVVDDERAVRDSLRRAFALEGYDVELAGDGAEAIAPADDGEQPDAVVLDVLMPGVDGLEVCRRVARRRDRTLPVLMLTARDDGRRPRRRARRGRRRLRRQALRSGRVARARAGAAPTRARRADDDAAALRRRRARPRRARGRGAAGRSS